jgi:HAD superfamily hydrolase (TIGR01490 family)
MKTCAFFNLDKTILASENTQKLSLVDKLKPNIKKSVAQLLNTNESNITQLKSLLGAVVEGKSEKEIKALVSESLIDSTEVFAGALDLIQHHKEQGHTVVLVSAAPRVVVEVIAEKMGIEELITTKTEIDSDGHFTGRVLFLCFGEAKALAIKDYARINQITLADSFAYADSMMDLPMLESVGHQVVCNPDNDLLKEAQRRSWEVKMYFDTQSLWQKMPSTAKKTVIFGPILATIGALLLGILKSKMSNKKKETKD